MRWLENVVILQEQPSYWPNLPWKKNTCHPEGYFVDVLTLVTWWFIVPNNWTHWQDIDSYRVPQCLPLLMHFDAIWHGFTWWWFLLPSQNDQTALDVSLFPNFRGKNRCWAPATKPCGRSPCSTLSLQTNKRTYICSAQQRAFLVEQQNQKHGYTPDSVVWKSYCYRCFKIRGCLVSRDINV